MALLEPLITCLTKYYKTLPYPTNLAPPVLNFKNVQDLLKNISGPLKLTSAQLIWFSAECCRRHPDSRCCPRRAARAGPIPLRLRLRGWRLQRGWPLSSPPGLNCNNLFLTFKDKFKNHNNKIKKNKNNLVNFAYRHWHMSRVVCDWSPSTCLKMRCYNRDHNFFSKQTSQAIFSAPIPRLKSLDGIACMLERF